MIFLPENIPTEFKALPNWALWKSEITEDKTKKVPYQVSGKRAKSNDPSTWSKFSTALTAYQDVGGFNGICFMMPVEPTKIIFIDIDHCIIDGIIEPWALEIVKRFDSYTERSQSGNGLHILIEGVKPIRRCRKHGSPFEIYDCLRPCYLTGNVVDGHTTIEARQEALNGLYREIFGDDQQNLTHTTPPARHDLPDDTLIQKAMQAKNGQEFKALWEGSTSSYGGDDSAADMAFANMLAFWTGGNATQIGRIFSQSGLGQRAKWRDRPDYRERTIQKAISDAHEFYVPPVCTVEVGVPIHEPPLTRERCDMIEAETGVHIYNAEDDPKKSEISEDDLLKIKIPENARFKTSLEPDNFIQEFIRYGETVTDSYPDYWFASGLYCISVAVNRNVVIKLRQGPIYPNVWINILGLSSLARKSTAIDKADLTIAAANIDPSCKMPDEFSPEAMIEMLDRQPRAYMIKDESAGLLAVMKKDYMRGLKDALMQLYDGKDINRELRTSRRKSDKTSFQVKNPYLNLMLATTPGSFAANTELLDVTSGWLPRFLHFFPNHVKDRWLPLEEGVPENDLLSVGCHARLIKIKGEFYDLAEPRVMHLSSEASAYFIAWQKARESELVEAKDDRRAQFYSRLAVYALKMGTLFTIGRAEYKDSMEISLDHMQGACRLVDEYFMPMAMTVADLVGKAADKNQLDKIMAVLTARGGKLTKKDLMRATHFKKKDIEDSLETLIESNEIKLVTVSNPHGPASEWVIMSQDSDKLNTVDTVYTDIPSIPSHKKKIMKDENIEGMCDGIDGSTNATVCDEKPIDIDSAFATKSETSVKGVDESDNPSTTIDPHHRKDAPTPTKDDPGLMKFKAGIKKRHCLMCGRHFSYDLCIHYKDGYICQACQSGQGPAPDGPARPNQQTTI